MTSDLNYPSILFKYMPSGMFETFFQKPCLRVTQTGSLNDPFDQQPSKSSVSEDQDFRKAYTSAIIDGTYCSELAQQLISSRSQHASNDGIGTLCLTESYDSLLMWAHYASEHKGFLIGLDATWLGNAELPNSARRMLRRVIYREQRPDGLAGDWWEYCFSSLHEVLCTKSMHWSYEQEWRLQQLDESDLIKKTGADGAVMKDLQGNTINLLPIPIQKINCIIFGARVSCATLAQVRRQLEANSEWLNVRLKLAHPDSEDYRLRFVNVRIEDLPKDAAA